MQVRFEPSSKVARTENLFVTGLAAVCFPAVMYLFYGIDHWAILAAGGFLLGAYCHVHFARRYRRLGKQVICISPTTIRTEHDVKQRELSWSDIGHIDFSGSGGAHWTLKPASGDPMILWLDGFDDEQRARIAELIQKHFQEKGSQADRV